MNKSLRWLFPMVAPLAIVSLSVFMTACGDDGDGGTTEPAMLESSSPADGATVPEGATVTLTFDKNPGDVMVNGAAADGSGRTRTFAATVAANTITWEGGSATLNFTLTEPDTDAPMLASSVPADGANDVDPEVVNQEGVSLTFNEAIASADVMISRDGTGLGWISSVEGDTVTLSPTGGSGLVNETPYDVTGSVTDTSGNAADVSVSFTTKAKE